MSKKAKNEVKEVSPIPKYCKDCIEYERPRCNYHGIFVARKNSCDNFARK